MKFLISNKQNSHLMTILAFNTEKEAKQVKDTYTKYWKKFNSKNPLNKSPRYESWKNSFIFATDFSKNFEDSSIVSYLEQQRNQPKSVSKMLKNYDSNIIQNKINKQITQSNRKTYANRKG